MEKLRLREIEGFAVLSGKDENGCLWSQFYVDAFADQENGECVICGQELSEGWMNLDCGGEEICNEHVDIEEG